MPGDACFQESLSSFGSWNFDMPDTCDPSAGMSM